MSVKELITELQKFDPELLVTVIDTGSHWEVREVKKTRVRIANRMTEPQPVVEVS